MIQLINKLSIKHEIPDDVAALKSLCHELLTLNFAAAKSLKTAEDFYRAKLKQFARQIYGQTSEKICTILFDEVEAVSAIEELETSQVFSEPPTTSATASDQGKGGKSKRKVISDSFPRTEVVHDLAAEEKFCTTDGEALVRIGEETREEVKFIPSRIEVTRHVILKYACPKCHDGVKCAHAPERLLPGTVASPSLLAQVAVSKYEDHLPLYRQERIFKRHDFDITRATLASWMIKVGDALTPLVNLIRDEIFEADALQCDETPVQVLKASEDHKPKKAYMWVMSRAGPGRRAVLYDYFTSRSGKTAEELLAGYEGYIQVDGYKGYDGVYASVRGKRLGCMAHVRRKFIAVLQPLPKKSRDQHPAANIVKMMAKLYEIETRIRDESVETRTTVRLTEAKPLFEQLEELCLQERLATSNASVYGQALAYACHELPRIRLYLDHGFCEIDNNRVENAIRPFALGRKNWMFCDTNKGAGASAAIYTVLQTAKQNGVDAKKYLERVFEDLPSCKTVDDYVKLLPWNVSLHH